MYTDIQADRTTTSTDSSHLPATRAEWNVLRRSDDALPTAFWIGRIYNIVHQVQRRDWTKENGPVPLYRTVVQVDSLRWDAWNRVV